jgi:DNA-binding MarR family transcriptional regulator
MNRKPEPPPELSCACAAVRHAARLVTQLYGEELDGPLEPPQFALLSVLDKRAGCNQAVLARALDFDKTTLSRNLKLMQKNGWIERVASDDQRERGYHLTSAGRKLLNEERPKWKRAQNRFQSGMSAEQWTAMWDVFRDITTAARKARKDQA